MRVQIHRAKNIYDEYTAQVDYGDSQILIFAKKASERNRMLKEAKKLIKPQYKQTK